MQKLNTLRDRLLVRLLSKASRKALFEVVFYDVEAQIDHLEDNPDSREHIAVPMCHLADLIEEAPRWVARLDQRTTTTTTEKN